MKSTYVVRSSPATSVRFSDNCSGTRKCLHLMYVVAFSFSSKKEHVWSEISRDFVRVVCQWWTR